MDQFCHDARMKYACGLGGRQWSVVFVALGIACHLLGIKPRNTPFIGRRRINGNKSSPLHKDNVSRLMVGNSCQVTALNGARNAHPRPHAVKLRFGR